MILKIKKEVKRGWKVLINRTRNDINLIQALIVFYLGYKAGLDYWYFLIAAPIYIIYKYFDIKYIHKQELDYSFNKNKKLMEMHKWIKEMHEKNEK